MNKMITNKRTIVWLHGWATSPDVWRHLAEHFPDCEHHYIDYSDCQEMTDLSAKIQRTLLTLTTPVTLIGWSLGGMLVLEHLLQSESLQQAGVRSAVIVGATLRFVDRRRICGWPEAVLRRMMAQLQTDQAEATLTSFRERVLQPRVSQDTQDSRLATTDFTDAGLLAGLEYLRVRDLLPLWELRANQFAPAVHWLHGSADVVCPPTAIPEQVQSSAIMFDGDGHAPFLTDEKRFVNELRRLLDGD